MLFMEHQIDKLFTKKLKSKNLLKYGVVKPSFNFVNQNKQAVIRNEGKRKSKTKIKISAAALTLVDCPFHSQIA